MNVGDTISIADLIAAWRDGLPPAGATPGAVACSRIAQASFGVDLSADPPALERTWTPDWVRDTHAFQHDRYLHRDLLARIARQWAALPAHVDPFESLIEAPLVICALHEQHARSGRATGTDAPLTELVGTLWNLDPSSTALVTTAAAYRTGPAARIVKNFPPDDEPIACTQCGWTGAVGETDIEYFRDVAHRECPRCEKMLLIASW